MVERHYGLSYDSEGSEDVARTLIDVTRKLEGEGFPISSVYKKYHEEQGVPMHAVAVYSKDGRIHSTIDELVRTIQTHRELLVALKLRDHFSYDYGEPDSWEEIESKCLSMALSDAQYRLGSGKIAVFKSKVRAINGK